MPSGPWQPLDSDRAWCYANVHTQTRHAEVTGATARELGGGRLANGFYFNFHNACMLPDEDQLLFPDVRVSMTLDVESVAPELRDAVQLAISHARVKVEPVSYGEINAFWISNRPPPLDGNDSDATVQYGCEWDTSSSDESE